MKIWVVKTSEMLATDQGRGRLLRSGQVAHVLDRRGHDVSWWISTFDHAARRQRVEHDATMPFGARGKVRMLRSPGYVSSVSAARLWDHACWGTRFARAIRREPRPDIIFCAYPTIESAWVCARFGRQHSVPVVIDMRDMWPDIFFSAKGPVLEPLLRIAFGPLSMMARSACRGATALFGITEEFVDWGLQYADRPRNEWDTAFPLAYPRPDPSAAADSPEACGFWDALSVRRENAFNVIMIGSLNGRANDLEPVFVAARALRGDSLPVKIIVCGDGDAAPRYRAMAADCDNVMFPGWISAPQIRELLQRSHLGLVPYRNSPDFMMSIPNKAIEYLSAGVPVGTSLRGTLQRLLATHQCGFAYDSGNSLSLVENIRALRDDTTGHRRVSAAASELFEREFVAENVYGALAQRLEDIAAAAKQGARYGKNGGPMWTKSGTDGPAQQRSGY